MIYLFITIIVVVVKRGNIFLKAMLASFWKNKQTRIRQNPQVLAKNVPKERQSRLLIKWKLRSVWNRVHNQEENKGSTNCTSSPNMFRFSIQGRGRGSIQFFRELILRTLVWFLKLLGPCSLSVNPSVCPLLINWVPPVSDKSRAGQKSQINFCKTGWKSVAEQRRATQANTLSKRKEETSFFPFCSDRGHRAAVAAPN